MPRIVVGALVFLATVTVVAYAGVSRYLERAAAVKHETSSRVNFAPPPVVPKAPGRPPSSPPGDKPPGLPAPTPPPSPVARIMRPPADASVRAAVEGWAGSLKARRVDAHMRYYGDRLQRYFQQSNVSRAAVYADKVEFLRRFPQIAQYDVRNVEVTYPAADVALAVFDKTWDFRTGDGRRFAGDEQEQLTLHRDAGGWRIISEQENKVYWARYP
jgi:ketosteroid isomerase-like protein